MEGILNVLKPPGMSSHDVVAAVRRMSGEQRVGHAGTLDPAAAGVLPVFVGRAVRLAEFTLDKTKAYRVEAILGVSTPTLDMESEPTRAQIVHGVTIGDIEAAASALTGDIDQEVPAYSAVQVGGQRLYHMARSGQTVPIISRRVSISSIRILSVQWCDNPRVLFDVVCSRGTFIRAICNDMGERLGVGGAMSFLIRTATGPFMLQEAHTLEQIAQDLEASLLPPYYALGGCARAVLNAEASRVLCHGIKPEPQDYCHVDDLTEGAIVAIFSESGQFLAVGVSHLGAVEIRKVLCQ